MRAYHVLYIRYIFFTWKTSSCTMSYEYYDSLDSVARGRYDTKLTLIGCDVCPYRLPAGVWQNNPLTWPKFTWGDMYSFLIDSPGVFTKQSLKAFKSLEAHNYFLSGWVQTVLSYRPTDSNNIILRADVRPSQRLNDEPHHPWVALSSDGTVAASHCNCMAGLGECCSHVAALLFKVEAAVRLGYTTKACTELPCKWNADFVQKIQPAEIKNITFYKDSAIERVKISKRKRTHELSMPTDEQKQILLKKLFKCTHHPVVLHTFNNFSNQFHWNNVVEPDYIVPQSLRTLFKDSYLALSPEDLSHKCSEKAHDVNLSQGVIKYIHDITQKQSNCLTWHEQRVGCITSSTVHQVLHTDMNKPAPSLIKTICSGTFKQLNVAPVIWGKENEQNALKSYTQIMTQSHDNFLLKPTGLLISNKHNFIAASTDSIGFCTCHGERVVEVKCPYTHRDKTYTQYMTDKSCCLFTDGNVCKLKDTHSYFSQIQLQMFVHDASLCDFVVYSPKFTIVCYVRRNADFIENMLETIQKFHLKYIMPELLTRALENSTAVIPVNDDAIYCICKTTSNSVMIGCDEPNCKIQWYHLDCVKLKRVPKGDWFCKTCRKNQ